MDLLTRAEAARALRVCTRSLDSIIAGGEMATVRIGRRVLIERAQIDHYVSRHRTGG